MANTYNKPETKTIKVESQQIMAGSGVTTNSTTGDVYTSTDVTYGKGFDFFIEEEEEAPGKSDDEDWEDWEEEDDP